MRLRKFCKLGRLLSLIVALTLFLMLLSTSFQNEVLYSPNYLLPCIYKVFEIPQRQTSYGFPLFWLANVKGIRQIGCGPVVGEYSIYTVLLEGLIIDLVFYASCCSIAIFLIQAHKRNMFHDSSRIAS